jgi:hypothetical protein
MSHFITSQMSCAQHVGWSPILPVPSRAGITLEIRFWDFWLFMQYHVLKNVLMDRHENSFILYSNKEVKIMSHGFTLFILSTYDAQTSLYVSNPCSLRKKTRYL